MIHMRDFNSLERKNIKFLVNKGIKFANIQITETGYAKSILDATEPVRLYFEQSGYHFYDRQPQGMGNKKVKKAIILTQCERIETKVSLYRPTTKKGDPRLWVYGLKDHIYPNEIFSITINEGLMYVIIISSVDILKAYKSKIETPLRDLINLISEKESETSTELLGLIRKRMSDWTEVEVNADTGVGRTVESLLGIPMNDLPVPDYKGIELKSHSGIYVKTSSLFTKAPEWDISRVKSGKELAEKYGYMDDSCNHKTLQVTINAIMPNPQNLKLDVNYVKDILETNEYAWRGSDFTKKKDVMAWRLETLHKSLLAKHKETFWIDASIKEKKNHRYFKVNYIDYTRNPSTSMFDTLIEQGGIRVDTMVCRPSGNGDTYSFKIKRNSIPLLFPEIQRFVISED